MRSVLEREVVLTRYQGGQGESVVTDPLRPARRHASEVVCDEPGKGCADGDPRPELLSALCETGDERQGHHAVGDMVRHLRHLPGGPDDVVGVGQGCEKRGYPNEHRRQGHGGHGV